MTRIDERKRTDGDYRVNARDCAKSDGRSRKAAKKAFLKKGKSGLLSYEKAKRLVEIFSDFPGVTTSVWVDFDKSHGRRIGKIPDMPKCREITIDYYMGDDENKKEKNYLLCLQIYEYAETDLINFKISTSVEETDKKERMEVWLKRGEVMGAITEKLKSIQGNWRKFSA